MSIYQDVRKMGPFTQESRKIGLFIYFLLKKGGQSYTNHIPGIRTMPYKEVTPPPRGAGVGGRGYLAIIVVRLCEPVFRNLPYAYTWAQLFKASLA